MDIQQQQQNSVPIKIKPNKNRIPRFDSNLNASTDSFVLIDPTSNKSKSRIIPLYEHEIKHVVFNVPEINSNRDGCRYLNVSFPRWKKYAKLYINKDLNKSYFQILLDKSNKRKGERVKILRQVHRKKKWDEWYVKNIIEKLNNNNLDVKIYTQKRLKEFLVDNEILAHRCACCGYSEKNIVSGRVPLLIDHINNDWNDFTIINLQLLCLNCFYQLVGPPMNYYRSQKDYM
jgi:hypothetical protein